MGIKSLLFTIFYYISVINWKIDELDRRNIGILYIILLIILPYLIPLSIWILVIWAVSIPRILYLLGIVDYFQKKVEK